MANGTGGDGLHQLNLNLEPNEASGLLTLENDALLEAHGWELAFWAVLDEGRVEDCVAVIGRERGAPIGEGWRIERLNARLKNDPGKTEDAESVARHDGWVYVFGSHFGSKDGPLQPKRGFVARFGEDDVEHVTDGPAVEMEVSRKSFAIHRIVNDAFKAGGPDLVPLGRESEEAFIRKTIERGEDKGKAWSGLVREGDYPINVEGAAFLADGTLLLGLRFPVSAEGLPILVGLEGIERLFGPGDGLPGVTGFWIVDAAGRGGTMAGVRDLSISGDGDGEEIHLVTGNIDSRDKGSVLLRDYQGAAETVATHFRCALPDGRTGGALVAEFVREFPALPRVEGIAIADDEHFFYVTDEDEGVHLRLTRLMQG